MSAVVSIGAPIVTASFSLGGDGLGVCKQLRLTLQMRQSRLVRNRKVIRLVQPVNLPARHPGDQPNR